MQFSWTGSPPLQLSKQPWLLLVCLGATRANFSVSGWSDHSWRSSLRRDTTRTLGSVCDGKLAPQTRPIEQCGTQHFRSRLEICVWEVQCHPAVAASIMTGLTDSPEQSFEALRICERILGERKLAVLTLESLVEVERPLVEDEPELSQPRHGWPREAARCAEKSFLGNSGRLGWTNSDTARCRSQRGPLASAVFTAFPTGSVCRIDAQPFRLLLCRR